LRDWRGMLSTSTTRAKGLSRFDSQAVTVSEKEIVLEIYALDEVRVDQQKGMNGEEVRNPPNWLPIKDGRENYLV
jgi:hypothetical protein